MLSRRNFVAGTLAVGAASRLQAQPATLRRQCCGLSAVTLRSTASRLRCLASASQTEPSDYHRVNTPFRVRVENHIDEPSLLHWHGLTPPWQQDGVPGVSGPAIPPGGSADYDFPLPVGGTYWMHSHYGFQEQLLLAAPLIIKDGGESSSEQDIVVEVTDFSFTPPEKIYADLRARQMPKMDMADMPGMVMAPIKSKPDLNDVQYDAFLANGRTLDDPEVIKVEPGGHVRLRIINAPR